MSVGGLDKVVRLLASSLGESSLGDADLLDRFLLSGDEVAFECLVRRHGPMVLATCRRVLGNEADAEDAFQATFLVLARKAGSVRPGEGLASWLHGVARRTAMQARRATARRKAREAQYRTKPRESAPDDLGETIDLELSRLPGKYREVVVLCDLEGLDRKAVAKKLGCPEGTVASRLARARAMLAARMRRSGSPYALTLSAPAPLPYSLVGATVEAAKRFAVGGPIGSSEVVSLAEGVIKVMWMSKLKVAVSLLLLAVVGLGAGGLSRPASTARAEPAEKPQPAKKAPREADEARRALEELDAARAELEKLNKVVEAARKRFRVARERNEIAKRQLQPSARAAVIGHLIEADTGKGSVRVNYMKEWPETDAQLLGDFLHSWPTDETFPVSKTTTILQDNAEARLADLKKGARVILDFDPEGKTVVKITVTGWFAGGTTLYVSANQARNTITVDHTAGKKGERKVFHLLKETEVKVAGKAARLRDLEKGATLILTLSAEDANTVIRIEAVPPG